MSPDDTPLHIRNNKIQKVNKYVYLGHQIRFGQENQQAEINMRY